MIGVRELPATPDVLVVGGGATGAGLMRDLSRRGLRCLMIDKGDLGSGTSGRYHGLLHSGARYIARDVQAARECIHENHTLRRIAPACVEDTGGLFVATPDDPDDYVEQFAERCAAADIPCEEVAVAEVLRLEPALNPRIRRAFRVPDASLEPWQLIEANFAEARDRGSSAFAYHQLVGLERNGGYIGAATIADVRSGSVERIDPRLVVSGVRRLGRASRRTRRRKARHVAGQGHHARVQPSASSPMPRSTATLDDWSPGRAPWSRSTRRGRPTQQARSRTRTTHQD